jgi:beta-N-acetylhexosaminidase
MKISLCILASLTLLSCSNDAQNKTTIISEPTTIIWKSSDFSLVDFFIPNPVLDNKVMQYFAGLDTNERAAQLIMPAVSSNNYGLPIQKCLEYYTSKKIGGAIFLKGNTTLFNNYANTITAISQQKNLLPMMISADAESALIHYKFTDIPKMIAAEKLKTDSAIKKTANDVIKILKNVGIQINFAPVADNNTNRAIIQNRSFGQDSINIVHKCSVWITEQTKLNIASTIKHFPGHGNVIGDTHKGSVYIDGDLVELPTFASLLHNNYVSGVMVAHITIKNNAKWNSDNLPSTLSRKIVTELLKDTLGFGGIIYTDAMNMGAVSKIPNASFKALCAGCDIALMPMEVDVLHAQIKQELIANGPFKKQFENSIKKIIKLKICLGLIK